MAGVLLLTAFLFPASGWGAVYKWVDENGVAHYTMDREEIPPRLRMRLTPSSRLVVEPAPGETTTAPEGGLGPPQPESESPEVQDPTDSDLAARIRRDREAIKEIISREAQGELSLGEDSRLREIAERLPRLQSEYRKLQREPVD